MNILSSIAQSSDQTPVPGESSVYVSLFASLGLLLRFLP
jgi:hypothetical protein